jgi:phosphoribosyl-ATP pyrophosphohydrolase
MLNELEQLIQTRKKEMPDGSYTTRLFTEGRGKIAQKVGEEATEVIVASLSQGRNEQIGELADLFYHTLVLMTDMDITLEDVQQELERRHRK